MSVALHTVPMVLVLTCGASATAAPSHRFAVGTVTVTDLGTLGGTQSTALGINDSGQIVGWSATTMGVRHAFLFDNGTMTDIGGNAFGPNVESDAVGITASGRIAGTKTDLLGPLAFVWDAGSVTNLFAHNNTSNTSRATAIANNGSVAGAWDGGFGETMGTWVFNKFVFNGNPGHASDVNSQNFVVGLAVAPGPGGAGPSEMWRIDESPGIFLNRTIIPPPLNESPGDALAINESGSIAGYATLVINSTVVKHAFLWNGVSATSSDLGVLPSGSNSVAEDINDRNFIAGHADERIVRFPFDITRERAFIYNSDFGMVALPALPTSLWQSACRAYALNERNASSIIQVVGACDAPSAPRAVRWDVTIQSVPLLPQTSHPTP